MGEKKKKNTAVSWTATNENKTSENVYVNVTDTAGYTCCQQ